MNTTVIATIAGKDLRQIGHRRTVLVPLIAFPLLIAIGLPLIVFRAEHRSGGIPANVVTTLLGAFVVIFVIGAAILPTVIASYSLVGEKVERSLEPLLATPATDTEILLGKAAAATLPPLAALWIGAAVFMVWADLLTHHQLGYAYFPTGQSLVTVLLVLPLAAILSVQYSVLVSARVTDIRAAQQLAGLIVLPFAALYLLAELRVFSLDGTGVAVLCIVLAVIDAALFGVTRATFRREEILTRWK